MAARAEPPNPFIGLRPFDVADSRWFFGREEQIYDLLRRLRTMHFVAVIGPSACGKSSLIRAGVLAALRDGYISGEGDWTLVTLQPGNGPVEAWLAALLPYALEGLPADLLLSCPAEALRPSLGPMAIVVDQLEELFQYAERTGRVEDVEMFLHAILSAASAGRNIYVILTMRSEYLPECAQFPALAEAINESLYLVPRLTREQMRQTIVRPVQKVGLAVAALLVEKLLDDVWGEKDGLPVLQHAMMRMWARRSPWEPLGLEAYGDRGLAAFLNDHAEDTLRGVDPVAAEMLFRAITQKTEDGRVVRRPMELSRIAESRGVPENWLRGVTEVFEKEGFLRAWVSPRSSSPLIDVSHEALARKWDRLRHWVDKESEVEDRVQELRQTAARWAQSDGRQRALLYRGSVLKEARALEVRAKRDNPAVGAFLKTSSQAASWRYFWLGGVALLVFALAGVVAVEIVQRQREIIQRRAEEQRFARHEAEYRQILDSQLQGANSQLRALTETLAVGGPTLPAFGRRRFLRSDSTATPAGSSSVIRHLVVLMLEGRSFDHILGYLKGPAYQIDGLTGNESNSDSTGRAINVSPNAAYQGLLDPDPGHNLADANFQIFGNFDGTPGAPPMQGFVKAYELRSSLRQAGNVMRAFSPSKVPVLTTLARQYAICDQWFSSVPGGSLPNRSFVHAGTSMGRVDASPIWQEEGKTIYELLAGNGISSSIYLQDQSMAVTFKGLSKNRDYFGSLDSFFQDVTDDSLPAYSFIEPRYSDTSKDGVELLANDEHADHNVFMGEKLIADVYNAIRSNDSIWKSTILVIVYSQHGGLYDHVSPPSTVNPDGRVSKDPPFDFTRLGVRVPAVIVSAYIEPATIDHTVYDHTSVIATARKLFLGNRWRNLFLTRRDQNANTFDRLLTRDTPRTDAVLK